MYLNTVQNRITFKIESGFYLELLTSETLKLPGSTEQIMTKDKNGENLLQLETNKLVLVIQAATKYFTNKSYLL